MARPPAKSVFAVLAVGLWILACQAALAEEDDPRALNQQLIQLIRQGKYQAAIPISEREVEAAKRALGPEHPVTAEALDNLGFLFEKTGDYAKAEPLFQEALRIRKTLDAESQDVATTLNNLGLLYQAKHEYAKAEPLLQEALRIRQKVFGPEYPLVVQSLNNLAGLYQVMDGKVKAAEPLLQEVVRIRQKVSGSDSPLTAESLNNLAMLYWSPSMYEGAKAEPLLREVLRIRQKSLGPEHPLTAQTLNNLAELYVSMGDYARAEPLLQEALRIYQKLGPENRATVNSLGNLGGLYTKMGDYAKAEPLFLEALRISQKVFGPDDYETEESIDHLGHLYLASGDYDKAEQPLLGALRICRKIFVPEHGITAMVLNNLANLYQATQDYAKAEPLYQEALQIRQKLWPEDPITAESLNNLASLYRNMGDYDKALPLIQEAVRISESLGSDDTATMLENFALLEVDLDRIDEATALARQGSAAKLKTLSKIFSFTSEEQRLAYLKIFDPYSLFPFLKGTESDLAAAVLRYKGVVLDSVVEDRLLAEASQGSEDQKLVEQLILDKRQLGQLLLQPSPQLSAQTNQRIEALEGEAEKIEGQLAQNVAGLGHTRHALTVRPDQVQANVPDNGVLIEYLCFLNYLGKGKRTSCYGAVLLFSKGSPIWIPLGQAKEIEQLVRRNGALVRDLSDEEELSENLRALYDVLWAPIEQALPTQTKKVIISPDGQLNFVSFATLLTKDQQFLAERYDLQYVASGRDLLREVKPSTAKEVILFANPDFDLASAAMLAEADNGFADPVPMSIGRGERAEIADWSFASLEGTQKEGDELTKKFVGWGWTPTDFTAKEATKAALLEIHSPYILHLATHGFFAKEDSTSAQTEPKAWLNDGQSVTKSRFFQNPMHRSGLALAGAQSTIETWKREKVPPVENDGILTAEDVSTLDLQGTWLVTLSACDTGSGQVRAGEGVMGLRRGFIEAGAQNLLMTLWPISDEVTVQIMSDFYDAAHQRGNAPEALAKVQREWLVQLRDDKGPKFDIVKDAVNGHGGLVKAVNLAGPFIMSSQGKP
jgi:CHAT domain-containing protein/Tfp pilus assembly protein PilF